MNSYRFEVGRDATEHPDTTLACVAGSTEQPNILKACQKVLGDHGGLMAYPGAYCQIWLPDGGSVTIITDWQ